MVSYKHQVLSVVAKYVPCAISVDELIILINRGELVDHERS